MSEELNKLAGQYLNELRAALGKAWDDLKPEAQALAEACAKDYAALSVKALAGLDVKKEIAHTRAQLASIKVAGMGTLANVFDGALHTALRYARTLLLGG